MGQIIPASGSMTTMIMVQIGHSKRLECLEPFLVQLGKFLL